MRHVIPLRLFLLPQQQLCRRKLHGRCHCATGPPITQRLLPAAQAPRLGRAAVDAACHLVAVQVAGQRRSPAPHRRCRHGNAARRRAAVAAAAPDRGRIGSRRRTGSYVVHGGENARAAIAVHCGRIQAGRPTL